MIGATTPEYQSVPSPDARPSSDALGGSVETAGLRGEALRRFGVVALLGVMTILTYGATYYLLTVLAPAIVLEMSWPLPIVVGGLSLGLVVSGAVAPWIGRRIEVAGGRAVLPAGCLCVALGLVGLGSSQSLWLYGLAWVALGLGMGSTFYEAAFASLGRQYGYRARGMITMLTIYGGFSSTICWPVSVLLVETFDWRGACFAYAGLMLLAALALRLCLASPPPHHALPRSPAAIPDGEDGALTHRAPMTILVALGVSLALSATISIVFSVHLVALLGAREVALAAAVSLGTLIGISQVGGRAVEFLIGRRTHPLWTLVASSVLMALGLGLLAIGWGWIALALVLYGGGVGTRSIASGTVPLALVGPNGYATLMGRLAGPSLVMQAIAPIGAAEFLSSRSDGAGQMLWSLVTAAGLNLLLSIALLVWGRPPR